MNLAVIGTGYVGLVTGTCFAECGNDVICVDIDEEKISSLQNGHVPFYEPGLEELVRKNLEEQRLSFTTDLEAAVRRSTIIFVAVGTPQGSDGRANVEQVLATANAIARAMNDAKTIVNKSTVPVGTTDQMRRVMTTTTNHPLTVVSNPEFLKEGGGRGRFHEAGP
ncbi:MAG: NAD(P)-binding domain-containing protein, partial [Candidatus Binatia bacterium]